MKFNQCRNPQKIIKYMKSNTLRHSLDFTRFSKFPESPNLKSLKLQVNELHTVNQTYRERNKMLERQIEDLNSEMNNLLKLNRKLANNFGNTQIQDLEQVFEGIYKKQMNDAFSTIDQLKQELDSSRGMIQILREENNLLKTKLLQYRKYVVQLSSSQEIPLFTPTTVEFSKDILDSLTILNKIKSVPELFDAFASILKPIAQTTLFFIHSSTLGKLYNSSQKHPKEKVRVQRLNLLVHGDISKTKAYFTTKDDLADRSYSADYMLVPGIIYKDFDYIIQCTSPVRSSFTENDLLTLSLLSQYLSRLLKTLQVKSFENLRRASMEKLIKLVSKLVTAKSLDALANLVDEHLAELFEFQEAGVVFVDHRANQFFIYGYSPKVNVKFCNEVIRLPIGMGFTGEVFKGSEVKVFENLKNKAGFNQDIDNVASTGDIKQCAMVKLPGPDGVFTGVLQISNKVIGKVNQNDLKMIQDIAPVLGHIIFGITNFEEAFDLTLKMKNSLSFLQASN